MLRIAPAADALFGDRETGAVCGIVIVVLIVLCLVHKRVGAVLDPRVLPDKVAVAVAVAAVASGEEIGGSME